MVVIFIDFTLPSASLSPVYYINILVFFINMYRIPIIRVMDKESEPWLDQFGVVTSSPDSTFVLR